jgi:tetratricopeptide (TPR) repeat protein
MTGFRRPLFRTLCAVTLMALAVSCASTPAKPANAPPAVATVPMPAVPPTLNAPAELQEQHQKAWALLQGGDARGSAQAFVNILKGAPDFYPSETGLGYAMLGAQLYQDAAGRFRAALFRDARYAPALLGLVEAELALGHTADAIGALERLVPVAPDPEAVRTRLEVLRLKEIQSFIDRARAARQAGRGDEARGLLEQALNRAPLSVAILTELAAVETERGSLETAELYAKRAISIDAKDAAGHAALGVVHEARGRQKEALAAYTTAAAIDPRWNDAVARVRDRSESGSIPKEFRDLDSAPTVTRAEAAAFIGMRLEKLLASAPRRVFAVATDVRQHWAEPWIFAVTGAGVMEIFPNHTFQPAQPVRRDELAATLATLVELAAASRPKELASWQQVRPRFADLPEAHLFYPPAALTVASGALVIGDDARFNPTRPVSGADFVRAIRRIQEIAGR